MAVVHTESGRTERFRHYMRKRFTFSEPQLAIMIELLLRGRQSVGELRTRASRMVSIDGLARLREELSSLLESNYIQTSGPLERRGVEVDNNLYLPSEGMQFARDSLSPSAATCNPQTSAIHQDLSAAPGPLANTSGAAVASTEKRTPNLGGLETAMDEFRLESQQLREEFESLKDEFQQLSDRLEDLRSDLGG